MNIERLIEEVKRFPVLYDQTSEKYRNVEYKEKIWKMIAATLQVKGGAEECKKKWASIRDQLRKTLQKRKKVSGQAVAHKRLYKYEHLLEFLVPYMTKPQTLTNVYPSEEGEEEFDEIKIINQDEYVAAHTESANIEVHSERHNLDSQIANERNSPQHSQLDKFIRPSLKRKKICESQESPSSKLMAYMLAEKEVEKKAARIADDDIKKHPVDAFLAGIAPTLKSFNPIRFHEAKGRIFSIVHELEMKQLIGTEHGYTIPTKFSPFSLATSSSTESVITTYPSTVKDDSNNCSEST